MPARIRGFRLSTLAGLLLLGAASNAVAQFYATQDADGDLTIVDEAGAEVPVATSDPVGERPDICPSDAYHIAEVPTDRSKLVLTDCATGEGQYTVEMRSSTDAPSN